jgi:hypothetical protein
VKSLRYIVTGPGIEEPPSYAEQGPALSRAITAALKRKDATFYVRDSVLDTILGRAESDERGWVTSRWS